MAEAPIGGRVERALEAVYREFREPVPRLIEGCPCCLDTREIDVLLNTPLRELTGEQLWRYVSGVFYTVGSVRDFRYLLPRILDVAINDPANSTDPEIMLCKIGLAEWQGWPERERAAIIDVVDAWLGHALARDLAAHRRGDIGWDTDTVLCGAARAGIPLSRYREALFEPSAASVLEDLRERYPDSLSAFWSDAPQGLAELGALIGY